jgi:cytidylate kinase
MKAITISRQYGSGGGEIGARLAERLNWHLIDHEIVARVARELGFRSNKLRSAMSTRKASSLGY